MRSLLGRHLCWAICLAIVPIVRAQDRQVLRLPVTRDNWFSDVGKEADANLGGAPQLKLKSIQEMSLVDLDPAPLKGHAIRSAVLHVRKRGQEVLHRVSISTFAADWVEGTATSYEPQKGSSCFEFRKFPDTQWACPGSDLTAVMLSQGGTIWRSVEASAPDAQGWMTIEVDPVLIGARVAGVSQGFLLFDDTGSEWTRQGEKFSLRLFPNRFVYSRDSNRASAPYFTIELGPEDHHSPTVPSELRAATEDLPAGEAHLSWMTPTDKGGAGVVGFFVEIDGRQVPQYLIPAAVAGQRVSMHLRDLGLRPGQTVQVAVRAVDGAGNASEPARLKIKVSDLLPKSLPGTDPQLFAEAGPLPKLGAAEVAIIDTLDKVLPRTGQMIPPQEQPYLTANHLWSAKEKRIRLHAARNELVSFQVLFRGPAKDVSASVEFQGHGNLEAEFSRLANVPSKIGPVPDPLVPLEGSFSVPPGDKTGSILCELYVPHDLPAGSQAGVLTLTSGREQLRLAIDLTVWDFELPDHLSFIPELNCYGLPSNELDYYRLAHRNRTVINRVPYYQTGIVADGCAPKWDGHHLDWTAWDKRFGKYLDGSAFKDLPRKGVPLDIFYLPLNENWPGAMDGNYNGSYWADQAFPPSYRRTFVDISREFAEHFNQKHWDQTMFLCFFNGKNNFKKRGWSHGSCPWILDEPTNFQDFWALRWFGQAFHEGTAEAPGAAKMLFRADISRPQWQRDVLDGVLNYNVVAGGAFRQYHRLVMDRKRRFGQLVIPYGSTNNPADSNLQPLGWCWDGWTLGADGVLPWQVIGSDESWKHAEDTCLFYPGGPVGFKGPVASIRLKAYLRGQQDAEYLALLARVQNQPRWLVGQEVRTHLKLDARRKGTGFTGGEDAGVMDYLSLRPQDVWMIRERIGEVLSTVHPHPE